MEHVEIASNVICVRAGVCDSVRVCVLVWMVYVCARACVCMCVCMRVCVCGLQKFTGGHIHRFIGIVSSTHKHTHTEGALERRREETVKRLT